MLSCGNLPLLGRGPGGRGIHSLSRPHCPHGAPPPTVARPVHSLASRRGVRSTQSRQPLHVRGSHTDTQPPAHGKQRLHTPAGPMCQSCSRMAALTGQRQPAPFSAQAPLGVGAPPGEGIFRKPTVRKRMTAMTSRVAHVSVEDLGFISVLMRETENHPTRPCPRPSLPDSPEVMRLSHAVPFQIPSCQPSRNRGPAQPPVRLACHCLNLGL